MSEQKRILSGVRATSPKSHIGNYEGAFRKWVELQNSGNKLFCMVADWHALTTFDGSPLDLRNNSLEVAKDVVACGLDPSKTSVFIQSDVKEHAELHLLLSMVVGVGKLERNPTYKDMTKDMGGEEMVSYGLLGYPVLQAADILLYKPYGVPVGKDQAPHLELSREIGRAFNARFGEVFPEFINMVGEDDLRSKLPGLDADENGVLRKMSKSYGNCIYISDTEDETAAQIKKAFTTPSKLRMTDPGIPEGCAVCQYLKLYSPNWTTQWDEDRAGERGCSQNKKELIECMNETFRPIRQRRAELDDATIIEILKKGAEEAREFASNTMDQVRRAMSLV